jgi:hypothetical protein
MSIPKSVIAAKCENCIYDTLNGGSRLEQIEGCTSEGTCALWPYRPLTGKTRERLKEERIAAMSPEELDAHNRKREIARERFRKNLDQ